MSQFDIKLELLFKEETNEATAQDYALRAYEKLPQRPDDYGVFHGILWLHYHRKEFKNRFEAAIWAKELTQVANQEFDALLVRSKSGDRVTFSVTEIR